MEPTETELVIRLYGITASERDQLCTHLAQKSEERGVPIQTEVSSDVLGSVNYETIIVVCAAIQASAEVIKTIYALIKPWLDEHRAKPTQGKEFKVEIVLDGVVLEPEATLSVTVTTRTET